MRKKRNERRSHSNSGARSVFRSCAFRYMKMNAVFFKPFRLLDFTVKNEFPRPVKRNAARFFHYIAHLTSKHKSALSCKRRRLYQERIAAHTRPGKTNCRSRNVSLFYFAFVEHRFSKIFFQIWRIKGKNLFRIKEILNTKSLDFLCRLLFRFCSLYCLVVLFVRLKHYFRNYFTVNFIKVTLVVTDSCLARIFFCNPEKRRLRIFYLTFFQTVLLKIFWNKIFFCNLKFFLINIAGKLDNLSTVKQRFRNRIKRIRRKNEEHIGNVERQIKVIVAERNVLLRVKNLKKRACRISLRSGTHLVNFVNHKDRRFCMRYLYSLNDFSAHRTDVCTAVTFYLRLIAHSANGKTVERLVHRICNGTSHGRFSYARRSYQDKD